MMNYQDAIFHIACELANYSLGFVANKQTYRAAIEDAILATAYRFPVCDPMDIYLDALACMDESYRINTSLRRELDEYLCEVL